MVAAVESDSRCSQRRKKPAKSRSAMALSRVSKGGIANFRICIPDSPLAASHAKSGGLESSIARDNQVPIRTTAPAAPRTVYETIATSKQQLARIQQVELLYPRQGAKGPPRAVSIASKQTLVQQALVQALDLEELIGSLSKPPG